MMHRILFIYMSIILCASVGAGGCVCVPATPRTFSFASGGPVELEESAPVEDIPPLLQAPLTLPPHAGDWEITDSAVCDVTGDGREELVLVVRRPWRDWPIMRWHKGQSPIVSYRNEKGMSCHLIVLEPDTGDEIWAGSALPFPILDMAAGDLDGDGVSEVATIRGEYGKERCGRSRFVDIWEWEDMGFVMKWTPIPGRFFRIAVSDRNGDGVDDLVLW